MKLSIIIVNFNTRDLTVACLESLHKSEGKESWEIIVIDNASNDDSIVEIINLKLKIKNLKIIENTENLGYAKANNQGIKVATGEYILLLNSDTTVEPHTISEMLAFMDTHAKAGVATCKVVLADGTLDPASHRGFPTPWASFTYFLGLEKLFPRAPFFAGYHKGYLPMDVAHQIDSPSGAFFLVRKKVIEDVGLLDEEYFMYGEDLDWAYRIKQKGWEIWFNPSVSITHFKKQSGRANSNPELRKKTQKYFYETMLLFYKKHYSKKSGVLTQKLVELAVRLRLLFT